MAYDMSIEVLDGGYPASLWAEAHIDVLIETAVLAGALDWNLHHLRWGVVLELSFADEETWDRFRAHPAVGAALDVVPNPVHGLLVYRGWGGSSSPREPRRPRPLSGAGAAALPLPLDDLVVVEPVRPRELLFR
ncbi:MAG: hypothetical protein ABR511_12825 [Acidimicrobiales bacterium]